MILPQSSTGPSDTKWWSDVKLGMMIYSSSKINEITWGVSSCNCKEFRKHPTKLFIKCSKYFQSMSALDLGYLGYWDLTEVQKILKQVKGCHGGLPLVGIRHIRHLHSQMEYWMGPLRMPRHRNPKSKSLLKDFERMQKIIHTPPKLSQTHTFEVVIICDNLIHQLTRELLSQKEFNHLRWSLGTESLLSWDQPQLLVFAPY